MWVGIGVGNWAVVFCAVGGLAGRLCADDLITVLPVSEVIQAGTVCSVQWVAPGLGGQSATVSLVNYPVVYPANPFGRQLALVQIASGQFDWQACASPRQYVFMVRAYSGEQAFSNPFTLVGSPDVNVTAPAKDETVQAGEPYTIRWSGSNGADFTTAASLEWMTGGCCWWDEFHTILLGEAATNSGSMTVTLLGDFLGTQPRHLHLCSCAPANHCCVDQWIEIDLRGTIEPPQLKFPIGGDVLSAGDTYQITWTGSRVPGGMAIDLLQNGQVIRRIAEVPASSGHFQWQACGGLDEGSYELRLSDLEQAFDYSSTGGAFVITGARDRLRVITPATGDSIQAGASTLITWDPTLFLGDVEFTLLKGNDEHIDIGFAPAAAGSYQWRICPLLERGDDYSVRVTGQTCFGPVQSDSGALRHPAGPAVDTAPSLTLIHPIGGELWEPGTIETVAWSAVDPFGEVEIILYRNGQPQLVEYGPMETGSYSLSLPPDIARSAEYTLVVALAGCGNLALTESGLFQINVPISPPPDLDGDGDVDPGDLSILVACLSQPALPLSNPDCLAADLDDDADVDQVDYGMLQRCINGEGQPASINCVK